MSRDEIRAVLDHHHPIIHTGMHILEEMHHLFKDIVPDILLIEMALSNEPDSLLDDSFGSVRPMTRVCVLRGYHNRAYVFGLLTSGSDGPLTDQDALEIINEATHDQHTGVAMSYNHRIVASKPTRQLKDQRSAIPALTTREIEVLHHLSVGKTNQAISQELSISEWTVRFHVKNIGSCWFTGEAVRLRGAGGAWGGGGPPQKPPLLPKTNK